ncbi:unnamed protein product [Bursaphelenchus okinawaensis]|uniref:V-type proton ATPase subunit G n=1 Tax=Bursaphelenchus okinawaensis TaxID=465554 RepID=A0A811JT75_9BILA|nr:unnamed protein product [Bursaphelenchus okinawaensis]CAG9082209.1 unnamed protein product [Bursaphelenchus okinawaensis]
MPHTGQQINVLELLISTEKKGQRLIDEARIRRKERIKNARDQANGEITKFRQQCEVKFQHQLQAKNKEMQDYKVQVERETETKLQMIRSNVEKNKSRIVFMLLDVLTNINPEVHRNLASRIAVGKGVFKPRTPWRPLELRFHD